MDVQALSEFLQSERRCYETEDDNKFAFSLGQVLQYYNFITITLKRYEDVNVKLAENIRLISSLANVVPPDKRWSELVMQQLELTPLTLLEIESFYLFAKILLDQTARFIWNYFGNARGYSLISHDKLEKFHARYRVDKNLSYPDGFEQSISFLKSNIADFRDKQISHLQNPRAFKGLMLTDDGQVRSLTQHIYPQTNDTNITSEAVVALKKAIDLYIQQVIELVVANRDRTQFELKKAG